MEITLRQLLDSRDNRAATQRRLLAQHPGTTLVCMTVVVPGAVKRDSHSLVIAHAGVQQLQAAFEGHTTLLDTHDLDTGFEAYLVTDIAPLQAKQMACRIEDTHPLGRLMDIDVLEGEGNILPRAMVGLQPRRCLLCGNEARVCMRARTHTAQQLQNRIHELVEGYV